MSHGGFCVVEIRNFSFSVERVLPRSRRWRGLAAIRLEVLEVSTFDVRKVCTVLPKLENRSSSVFYNKLLSLM